MPDSSTKTIIVETNHFKQDYAKKYEPDMGANEKALSNLKSEK